MTEQSYDHVCSSCPLPDCDHGHCVECARREHDTLSVVKPVVPVPIYTHHRVCHRNVLTAEMGKHLKACWGFASSCDTWRECTPAS